MDITEAIVSSGHGGISPSYLVIHSTSDPGATADDLLAYWKSGAEYMAHYIVDWRGVCYHAAPDDVKLWHCGNGNSVSIGIEICEPSDDSYLAASWDRAVEAARAILDLHGWGVAAMVSHDWMSRNYGGSDHDDPLPFFARMGRTWDEFASAVGDASQDAPATIEDWSKRMGECIIQPNGENRLLWCDGQAFHGIASQDEITAINLLYQGSHGGQSIPMFAIGSADAPWFTRLMGAYQRTA